MSTAIKAAIAEQLEGLDDYRQAEIQAEILDYVEYIVAKSKTASMTSPRPKAFDPMRYSGTLSWPVEGLAYQEAVRKEWE